MKFKSIRTRLISATIIILAIVVILLSVVSGAANYYSTVQTLQATMTEAANVGAGVIEAKISVMDKLMSEMATTKLFMQDGMTVQKVELLEQKSAQYADEYKSVFHFADSSGRNVKSNKSVSGQDYFISAMQGTPYISRPYANEKGSLSFIYSYPVTANNKIYGVIYMEFDYNVLYSAVEQAAIGESGFAYILDKSGSMLINRDAALVEQGFNAALSAQSDRTLAELAALEQRAESGEAGFGQYAHGGENYVLAFAPVANTSWTYYIATKQNEFMGGFWLSILFNISAGVIIAVLSAVLMSALASKIASPVKSMAQRVSLLAQGNLSQPVESFLGRDESAQLSQSTAQTVNTLQNIIGDISNTLAELAHGNLAVKCYEDNYVGEFKPIMHALHNITYSLNEAMLQINRVGEQVAGGAAQVYKDSQELSAGTAEQASSVQELAATITEISDNITMIASSSAGASTQTQASGASLSACNDHMAELNTAMSIISAKANEIGKIVKAIDDIAFQTNILALNAAVEAARAGAAGKGFAVVANEVRSLAAKSAEAAKTTTALIEDTRLAVNNGARIADVTGCALLDVVSGAQAISKEISKISHAASEQAGAIQQVTNGMELISGVVQTNSATAQQSAAASEQLAGQAQILKELVSRFTLSGEEQQENIREEQTAYSL